MSDTANLALPLLESGQAQKHVTVNEALARVDALAKLVLQSASLTLPPVAALDGQVWAVPTGAVNAWAGQAGRLAVWLNGGWDFATPQAGWSGFLLDTGAPVRFDGTVWTTPPAAVAASGAAARLEVLDLDEVLGAGGTLDTAGIIPAQSIVLGVTLRVSQAITGTLTSWTLGVAGAEDRYGSGLGLGLNAWGRGLTGTPVTYYADTPLRLTGVGGDFAGGAVRLAVHRILLDLPSSV